MHHQCKCHANEADFQVGQPAPDFSLDAYVGGVVKKVGLKDYKGKWIVLFFYPEDFTFVCPTEIKGFAKHEDKFKEKNAVVIGASTDSVHSHKAWFEKDLQEVKFPVLADTAHTLSRSYHVLIKDKGIALRGTFIIDPEGVLKYIVVSDLNVGRSVGETLRVLEALQSGDLCPVEWEPGEKTLGKA
ncbi:MAG: thioredoxin peroxidase [Candidatus Buchananbacteria bacterium CG10_big_fil_rev_8_21_14_0_10_42_9]|uniref:Thioredoxin peroxidase n=1 Tax=Candidatus Buchananbacteria bacterium CG10_big_fil_rev_8_21_14_0_10_42_9 TaxID=1974526 RepID=A0A2H0W201_9BACT|nr:MAG: thioredoxin peroxidase [Candidatus Buchananbacteria bacterium CG10_big_fil_rev_8_21_14_0_10_42_9]